MFNFKKLERLEKENERLEKENERLIKNAIKICKHEKFIYYKKNIQNYYMRYDTHYYKDCPTCPFYEEITHKEYNKGKINMYKEYNKGKINIYKEGIKKLEEKISICQQEIEKYNCN